MKSFLNDKLRDFQFSNGLAQALAEAEKGHGSEIALQHTEPILLDHLRKSAIITSTISSCAIEGIVAPEFEAIADQPPARSLTREERELGNYKKALEFVYRQSAGEIRIEPDFIRQVHGFVMADAADSGEYKRRDNQIVETSATGIRVRFTPVPYRETERFMEQLCLYYNAAIQKGETPKLLTIAALTLDLTAIHPFSDGNGRVSRVIATAALLSEGYQLPRYISLEEIVDRRDTDYYRALELSSEHWHSGQHDLAPFLTFHTQVVAKGYRELELRRERSSEPVTVVLHRNLPEVLRESVWKEFRTFYPAATLEITSEGVKESNIKGHQADLPEAEWEKLNRADRLIRQLVASARAKQV